MGDMTRLQIVTEVADTCGKALSAASVSGAALQTRVQNYVNWGQLRIARTYDYYELNSLTTIPVTVANVKIYPFNTGAYNLGLVRCKDINSIRLIDNENSRKLVRWDYRNFDTHYPRPENFTGGRPKIYTRWGNAIELFRIPDAEYSLVIRYSMFPTPLTSDGQTSDFTNKDQLIVTAGVLETYLALEEYQDAEVWLERFKGHIEDAKKAESDIDWEPEAEPGGSRPEYYSGEPWIDPYGSSGDPLSNYPE